MALQPLTCGTDVGEDQFLCSSLRNYKHTLLHLSPRVDDGQAPDTVLIMLLKSCSSLSTVASIIFVYQVFRFFLSDMRPLSTNIYRALKKLALGGAQMQLPIF